MPSSTSPNMVLFLPVPGSTAGPQWASETTSNWSTVDTHDHTTGKGVQIPIAALNVNADFSWLTFGQTNIGYAAFTDKLATGNLTVNQSLGNVAGDPYWRNASGVVKKISLAGDALTLPNGTAALGSLLFTAIAAPSSPSAGFGSLYFDSTATNIAVKNSSGVVKHGVQTKAAVLHQFLTSIADDGSSVLAQPSFSDISGGSVASGTAISGSLLFTNIAAPGAPSAGTVIAWTDSTTRNWSTKDSFGNVSVSVVPTTSTTSQWFNSVGANGVFGLAQPAFTDISGSIAIGQIANSLITYAKIQNVSATAKILGRASAGAGVIEELSTSGSSAGRLDGRVLLARGTPSASATPVTASWTAGLYAQIIVKFWGRTNGYLQVQVNGDTGLNYSDFGFNNIAGAGAADNAAKGTNGFARLLVTNVSTSKCILESTFFPLTDGFERAGQALSTSIGTAGTAATSAVRYSGFCWHNTASDVTSFTVFPLSGQTMTGVVEIWGVPA